MIFVSPILIFTICSEYGWEFLNSLLVSIITNNLQAYLAFVEMSSCGCRKEWLSNRSKFFSTDLVCNDLCKSIEERRCRKRFFTSNQMMMSGKRKRMGKYPLQTLLVLVN